jgi:hypothetical protein
MEEKEFIAKAIAAGASPALAALLWNTFAQQAHQHLSEDIVVDSEDGETLDQFVDAVSEALEDDDADVPEEGIA